MAGTNDAVWTTLSLKLKTYRRYKEVFLTVCIVMGTNDAVWTILSLTFNSTKDIKLFLTVCIVMGTNDAVWTT